ncbi:MAG: NAD(P)/FAD-dependent oxidoreductase, partial [Actinomycetota bacterium]
TDVVVIVGGGNSAGQAAMFLSRSAGSTYVVVRADGLSAMMSSYLTQRIDADPDVTLLTHSEVVELHGTDRLDAVTIRNNQTGEATRIDTGALFIMIGAVPNTDWLPDDIDVDDRGFVVTGASSPFAASVPGVFAVGDIRSGSIKRVASAVGEGSVVVSAIHDYLDALAPASATVTPTTAD